MPAPPIPALAVHWRIRRSDGQIQTRRELAEAFLALRQAQGETKTQGKFSWLGATLGNRACPEE